MSAIHRTLPGDSWMFALCHKQTHAWQQPAAYSITSSAMESKPDGTSMPSARAVWRLMTNSNLVDCSTGRSAVIGALKDAPGIEADLTIHVRDVGSVAHQPANGYRITLRISRRNFVTRGQGGKLHGTASEKAVWSDEESIRALARKAGKSRINFADRRGIDDLGLNSDGTGDFLRDVQRGLGADNIRRIKEYGNANSLGTMSCKSRSRLPTTSLTKKLIPVALPLGRARLATRPSPTGSSPTPKMIGIVAVAALAASTAGALPGMAITATCRRTKSARSAGRRSYRPSNQWYSTVTFWPST